MFLDKNNCFLRLSKQIQQHSFCQPDDSKHSILQHLWQTIYNLRLERTKSQVSLKWENNARLFGPGADEN